MALNTGEHGEDEANNTRMAHVGGYEKVANVVSKLKDIYNRYIDVEGLRDTAIDAIIEGIRSAHLSREVRVFIPVIGEIKIPSEIVPVMVLPLFERLQQVYQLSTTYLFYPGATHTRLEHSLGVAELTRRVFAAWTEKRGLSKYEHVKSLEKVAFLAALLHDIGHPVWGHVLDSITGYIVPILGEQAGVTSLKFKKLDKTIASYLLLAKTQLREVVNTIARLVGETGIGVSDEVKLADIVYYLIAGEEQLPAEKWARDLEELYRGIACTLEHLPNTSCLDADRLDYLLRDLHHTHLLELQNVPVNVRYANAILREFINSNFTVPFRIGTENKGSISLPSIEGEVFSKNYPHIRDELRNYLYDVLYESFARAFIDSLIARLGYTVIKVLAELAELGEGLPAPQDLHKLVVSYMLLSPYEYIEESLELTEGAFKSGILKEPLSSFVERTYSLKELYYSLRATAYAFQQQRENVEEIIEGRKSVLRLTKKLHISAISVTTITSELKKILRDPKGSELEPAQILQRVSSFTDEWGRNAFRAMLIEGTEKEVNEKVSSLGHVLLLPVAYASKYIVNKQYMQERNQADKSSIEEIVEHIIMEKNYPIVYIIINTQNENNAKKAAKEAKEILKEKIVNLILWRKIPTN